MALALRHLWTLLLTIFSFGMSAASPAWTRTIYSDSSCTTLDPRYTAGSGNPGVANAVTDCVPFVQDNGHGAKLAATCDTGSFTLETWSLANGCQGQSNMDILGFGYIPVNSCEPMPGRGGGSHFVSTGFTCSGGQFVPPTTTTTTTSTTPRPPLTLGEWRFGAFQDSNCQTPRTAQNSQGKYYWEPTITVGYGPDDCVPTRTFADQYNPGGSLGWMKAGCDGGTPAVYSSTGPTCSSLFPFPQTRLGCHKAGSRNYPYYLLFETNMACPSSGGGPLAVPGGRARWTLQLWDTTACQNLAGKKSADPNPLMGASGDCVPIVIFGQKVWVRELGCQADGSGTPDFKVYDDGACTQLSPTVLPAGSLSMSQGACTNFFGGMTAHCTTTTTTTVSTSSSSTASSSTTTASGSSTSTSVSSSTTSASSSTTSASDSTSSTSVSTMSTGTGATASTDSTLQVRCPLPPRLQVQLPHWRQELLQQLHLPVAVW